MKRLGYAIGIMLATLGGCGEEQGERGTFYTSMPGKGDQPIACPITDACAKVGQPTIALDAPLCAEADARQATRPEQRVAADLGLPQSCAFDASCFPRAAKGALRTEGLPFSEGSCGGIETPHYWFRGGDKPYLLSAQLERVTGQSGSPLGRGMVRFEVRRFENGRSTDPRNENPEYFDDRYDQPVYPGDTVVIIPVPTFEYWFIGLADAQFHVTFLRTEMTAAEAPGERLAEAKPDYYIADFSAAADEDSRTVTFTVKVCNQGGSSDAPIDVEVRRASDTAPKCGDAEADFEKQLTGMFWEGVQHCRLYSFQQLDAEAGTFAAWASVDAECSVDELDENNNVAAIGYAVAAETPPPAEAKLTLPELKAHVDGRTVHVRALVCNVGLTPTAPGAKLELWPTLEYGFAERWISDPSHTWELPALTPLGTTTACTEALTYSQPNVEPGNYTAHVKLDGKIHKVDYTVTDEAPAAEPTESAAEPTEPAEEPTEPAEEPTEPAEEPTEPAEEPGTGGGTTAPGGEGTEPAAKPDVYVSDFSVKISGDVATFSVMVCNHSAQVSPPTKLGLFFDVAAPQCGADLEPDVSWDIPALEQSDCVTKSASTVRPQGSFTASAMADVACAVAEEDEKNAKNYDYAIGDGNTPPKSIKEDPEQQARTDPVENSVTGARQSPTIPEQNNGGNIWGGQTTGGEQGQQGANVPAAPGAEATGCQIGTSALSGPGALLPLLLLLGLRRRRRA